MPAADSERFLELFDRFNLERQSDRRMAVYALTEYFKSVLTDVGRNKLDLPEVHNETMQPQWGSIVSRLSVLDGFGDKEEKAKAIYRTKGLRNDVAHNTLIDPSKTDLERLRDKAEDWEDWLSDWVDHYIERKADLTPRELMEDMMSNMVADISSSQISHFEDEYDELLDKAETVEDQIEALEDEEEFSLRHIEIFKRVQEIHAQSIQLEEKEMEYDMHLEDLADAERERRKTAEANEHH